jgi:AcrR family transcriptional regulator
MKDSKRQDIVKAAMELFAMKGFRGTTTRDLAAQADVNEAIIFRHFKTKQELYLAILEEKLSQGHPPFAEMEALAALNDDEKFLVTVGHIFLEKHEQDTTFMRLLLFSALEGHELSDMFLSEMAGRDPLANYLKRRMDEGALRQMDPHLAARAFIGMFVSFVQWQEIFGLKKTRTFDRDEVVKTFVSTFLTGIKS